MLGRTQWKALVAKAREDSAPSVDIAEQVAQRIALAPSPQLSNWPDWSAAGVSVAAAVLMMATALLTGVSWGDPMEDWFSSMFLVIS